MSVIETGRSFHLGHPDSSKRLAAVSPQGGCPHYNLIRTYGGTNLPREVCLGVLERVIDADPKSVGVLMCLSKRFYFLLKAYEHSITNKLATDQSIDYPVRPSLASPEYLNFRPFSYPWLSEIRSRVAITNLLVQHDISAMERLCIWGTQTPQQNSTRSKSSTHEERIKRDAVLLLYEMLDSTVGLKLKNSIRARQVEFLEMLSPMDLAKLGYFVKALGLGYSQHMRLQPNPNPATDCHHREHICVFENNVLRYGPFFALTFVAGTQETRGWAHKVMLEGLDDMEAFETTQTVAFASLQSVVWHLFCKKVECDLEDSWAIMGEVIQDQKGSDKL